VALGFGIADFRLPIAGLLECPTNFSLSFVRIALRYYIEYIGPRDKLKFVGHSSKSAFGNPKSAML